MEEKEKSLTPGEFKNLAASQKGDFIIHVKFDKEEKIEEESEGRD